MNYREALLLAPTDLGVSGTKTVDLDVSQPISRITLRFKTTKVLSHMTAPGPANIPKIELVSGSTPLVSVTGYECQALNYYNKRHVSMEHGQHIATLSETDYYHLDFGRHLWDPLLAFDPKKFMNPQLRITWNEALADTSASVNELEIWALIFDEKVVSPIGFLQAVEEKSYTQGASGSYEETSIPEDKPIRQILVRGYLDGYEPWYNIAEVRFDEGGLARIPWEFTDMETYYRRMEAVWPMIHTPFVVGVTTTARVFYLPQTNFWASISGLAIGSNSDMHTDGTSLKGGKASLLSTADRQQVGVARGYLPWHTFQFPLGLQDDPSDWYDPKNRKPRLRVRSYTGGASSTCQVVLEKLHKY